MTKQAVDDQGVLRDIVSRKEAKEKRLDRYFTGKACKRGHISERYLSGPCIVCVKEKDRSEYKRKYKKKYYKENKESFRERYQENKNRGKIAEYSQNRKEHMKNYYQENKEYFKEYFKNYYQENKEDINEHRKEYHRKRYSTDENYKTACVCRAMLKRVLNAISSTKDSRTYEALGYCNEELHQNISQKLLDGMSWDNYGEWHIDHVIPVSRYINDYNIIDPAVINSLDNLIPMWDTHNLEKSARTLKEYLDDNSDLYDIYGHFLKENQK